MRWSSGSFMIQPELFRPTWPQLAAVGRFRLGRSSRNARHPDSQRCARPCIAVGNHRAATVASLLESMTNDCVSRVHPPRIGGGR